MKLLLSLVGMFVTPATQLNLLGAAVVGAGVFPISRQAPVAARVVAPPNTPTAAYGAYLVTLGGCRDCHGADLQGGTNQFTPSGPHLPVMVSQWTVAQFVTTMRTGVDPYGNPVDPERMPWRNYADAFSDAELTAIYAYIRALPVGE